MHEIKTLVKMVGGKVNSFNCFGLDITVFIESFTVFRFIYQIKTVILGTAKKSETFLGKDKHDTEGTTIDDVMTEVARHEKT